MLRGVSPLSPIGWIFEWQLTLRADWLKSSRPQNKFPAEWDGGIIGWYMAVPLSNLCFPFRWFREAVSFFFRCRTERRCINKPVLKRASWGLSPLTPDWLDF